MPNTLKRLGLAEVAASPDNVRTSIGDVDELAESIVNTGLLQPITAYKDGELYRIVAGHRRRAAIALAVANGLLPDDYKIDVIVQPKPSDSDRLAQMLVENMQREDLSLVDQVHGIFALVSQHSWTVGHVAEQLGLSLPLAKQRAKWGELPDSVLAQADAGDLKLQDLDHLLKLPADVREKLMKSKNLRGHNIDQAIDEIKHERKVAALARKLTKLGHIGLDVKKADGMPPEAQIFLDGLTKKKTVKHSLYDETWFVEKAGAIITPALILCYKDGYYTKVDVITEETDSEAWERYSRTADVDSRTEDELTDYELEERRLRQAREDAIIEHREKVRAIEVAYLTDTKPATLLSAVVMAGIKTKSGQGWLSAAGVKLLAAVGCDVADIPDQGGKRQAAVVAFAGQNSANMARVAAALSVGDHNGINVPGLDELGRHPDWDQFRIDGNRFDEDGRRLSDEEYTALIAELDAEEAERVAKIDAKVAEAELEDGEEISDAERQAIADELAAENELESVG